MGLTKKQQVFINEYLICWNASEAARRAGYNGRPNSVGHQLLTNIEIKQAIETRINNISKQVDSQVIQNTILELPVRNKRNTPDKIYFIQAENGLVKIGITNNVKSRFIELNVASPVDLKLLFVIEVENAKSIEHVLHVVFAAKRVKGEWFRLSESDISFVKNNYGIKS